MVYLSEKFNAVNHSQQEDNTYILKLVEKISLFRKKKKKIEKKYEW